MTAKLQFEKAHQDDEQHNGRENGEQQVLQQYLKEICKTALLDAEAELQLAAAAQAGCKGSRDRMISANLRLVVSVATKFQHRGLSLLDLIQEGNTGLLHALTKFDTTAGFRFSTYAIHWIRERMQRAIVTLAPTIRIPENTNNEMMVMMRAVNAMKLHHAREPSDKEIAMASGLPMDRVRMLMRVRASSVCYAEDLGDDLDVVAGNESMEIELMVDSQINHRLIAASMNALELRERQIISMRFGLHGEPLTLEDVAVQIGLSRERVRQLQDVALSKMRRTMERPQIERRA